jgi:class 3 adenylate cyclase/tetratricopeptide (TPR) repeat protein
MNGARMRCAACGLDLPAAAKFCAACGARLTRPNSDAASPSLGIARAATRHALQADAAPTAASGERKQVSVLIADVKGSMELSRSVDVEVWWEVMRELFGWLCAGVNRYGGRVERFTGDGVMAVFGAPVAFEDHAQRACRAALWLRGELAGYAERLRDELGLSFAVRIGLNSGEVVVGTIGDEETVEYTAVGHTAGLAQRMESLAEPGTVYLSESTARLVRGFFALEERGARAVKGIPVPVPVFELAGSGEVKTWFERARKRGLSRFVSRELELTELERALAAALAGDGQVVAVVGDPGVGKSRLCYEFGDRCRARGIEVWEAHALGHTSSVPFVAVLELLRGYFEIAESDSDAVAREKVAARLTELGLDLREDLLLVLELLGVADPDRSAPQIDPEARQRRLFAALNRIVVARGAVAPGVIVVEDLHWLDPGSGAFLENLVKGVADTRTLVLTTYRPGYDAGWLARAHVRELRLEALDERGTGLLLSDLLGSDPSLDGLVDVVRERTGGNPFFIEETVSALAERGSLVGRRGAYRLTQELEGLAVPSTVEAVLAARIDRLHERDKRLLQIAAVIGRQFAWGVLEGTADLSRSGLEKALGSLIDAELVFPTNAEGEYEFKHALAQEVTYHSQLARNRGRIHRQVAARIAELYADRLDELAALIAHHWEAGRELLQAAQWRARAATWAGFTDPQEARRHWRSVQRLSDSLPDSKGKADLALGSRIMLLSFAFRLGVPAEQTPEHFEREMKALYEQARELAAAGDNPALEALVIAVYGSLRGFAGASDWLDLVREAVDVAERLGDSGLWVAVLPALTYALRSLGRYEEGLRLDERAVELTRDNPTLGGGWTMACPAAYAYGSLGLARAMIGQLESSRSATETAVAIAHEHGDIENEAWASMAFVICAELGGWDTAESLSYAERAVDIAERTGGAFSRANAQVYLGIALVMAQRSTEAIAALQRARELSRGRRVGLESEPLLLCFMARAHVGLRAEQTAKEVAREAVELAVDRRTRGYELQSRLVYAQTLKAVHGSAAETELDRELSICLTLVAETGARGLEPRVHVELAELARLRGEHAACRRQLREAHRLFVEIGAPSLAARVPVAVSG